MSYKLVILRRAQRELASIPKPAFQRVREAIAALADSPAAQS